MPGAIAIVVLLVVFPVVVIMSGAFAAGVIGELLYRDGRVRNAGSELLELDD